MKIKTALLTLGAFTSLACGSVQAKDLRAASWYPPSHTMSTVLYEYYAKKANEYSEGSLEVEADVGSALVSPRDALNALSSGLVDVTVHMGQYTPSMLNISIALEEVAMDYVDVPQTAMVAAITDFSIHDPEMLAQWKRNDIVYGGPYITQGYKLVCSSPVTSLEEAKGKRVRMPNRAMAAFAESIGMIPVSMSGNEQYSALDKGVLDCTTSMLTDAYQRRLYEVASYATDMPLTIFFAGFAWGYNQDTWAELSDGERRSLFKAQAAALSHFLQPGERTEEENAYDKLPEVGVAIQTPGADLTEALNKFKKEVVSTAPEIASRAYNVESPNELYRRFDNTVKKWASRVKELGIEKLNLQNRDVFQKMLEDEVFGTVDFANYGLN